MLKKSQIHSSFFGDKSTTKVKSVDMCSYAKNLSYHGQPKTDNFKNKAFNEALKEAEKSYTHILLEQQTQDTADKLLDDTTLTSTPWVDLHSKIKKHGKSEEELETSLTLAAEAGTALLSENIPLKDDLKKLAAQNARLTAKVMNLDAKIETMETEEKKYLDKIETLYNNIEESQGQMEVGKKHQLELKQIYEDHDNLQNQIINDYIRKIDNLEKNISRLQHDAKIYEENNAMNKTYQNVETQTHTTEPPQAIPALMMALSLLKERQGSLERAVKYLQEQNKPQTIPSSENETSREAGTKNSPATPKSNILPGPNLDTTPQEKKLNKTKPTPLDEDDHETYETRSPSYKHIRRTAVDINNGLISEIMDENHANVEKIKIFSFPPEETPLLTTQHKHRIPEQAPPLALPPAEIVTVQQRLRDRKVSFNNFITSQDAKGNTKIIICFSSKYMNWKKKLLQFMELANECIKFPILFSINLEEVMKAINLTEASVRELLQVFLQFLCNAYLHRIRMYIRTKNLKTIVYDILDNTMNKNQRKISKVSPTRQEAIYNLWRVTQGSLASPNRYDPPRPSATPDKTTFIQAAMNEQRELWKAKEKIILQKLSSVYKEYEINHLSGRNKIQEFREKQKINMPSLTYVLENI
ncbi:hypothetical protein J6590_051208 [Homalodisca vitripennis]|nr:hypothetical protein J6590_051208 [Homalodisca vitripennis]